MSSSTATESGRTSRAARISSEQGKPKWRPKEFSEFADYMGVILFPHVPNAIRLSDMMAIGIPIFVPSEPYVYRTVWPMAGPYCGFSEGREAYRERSPYARSQCAEGDGEASCFNTGEIFLWQSPQKNGNRWNLQNNFDQNRFWFQLTEWKMRENALIKFGSVTELLGILVNNRHVLFEFHLKLMVEQKLRLQQSVPWWQKALRSAGVIE